MMDLQKREKYVKTALTVYELQKLVSVRMKECFALLCCKYPNKPNSRGNRANTSNWLGIVLQQNNGDLSPAFLQQASARLESIDCVGRRDYQNYAHHHPCHGDQLQPAPFPDAAENI